MVKQRYGTLYVEAVSLLFFDPSTIYPVIVWDHFFKYMLLYHRIID